MPRDEIYSPTVDLDVLAGTLGVQRVQLQGHSQASSATT